MDNQNVVLAKKIYLLNSFVKKSTNDYKIQIKIAETIIDENSYEED